MQEIRTDRDTVVAALRNLVRDFVNERDWQQFHSPKNLSMALAIEAAELMEHFQWITPEASRTIPPDSEAQAEIADELADVLCYVVALANELNLDLSTAMSEKMQKNRTKYPADQFRGRYGERDER